jgi:hypothetical protein
VSGSRKAAYRSRSAGKIFGRRSEKTPSVARIWASPRLALEIVREGEAPEGLFLRVDRVGVLIELQHVEEGSCLPDKLLPAPRVVVDADRKEVSFGEGPDEAIAKDPLTPMNRKQQFPSMPVAAA